MELESHSWTSARSSRSASMDEAGALGARPSPSRPFGPSGPFGSFSANRSLPCSSVTEIKILLPQIAGIATQTLAGIWR